MTINKDARKNATFRDVQQRSENGWEIWRVKDPQALTQVAGWLRFTSLAGVALFRGQTGLYETMLATGLRGTGNGKLAHLGGGSEFVKDSC